MHGTVYNLKPFKIALQICGFFESQPEEENASKVESGLEAFAGKAGVTWEEYVNFDDDLPTTETMDKVLEKTLLSSASDPSSALRGGGGGGR